MKRTKFLTRKRGSVRQRGKAFPVKPPTGSLKLRLPKVHIAKWRRPITKLRGQKLEIMKYVVGKKSLVNYSELKAQFVRSPPHREGMSTSWGFDENLRQLVHRGILVKPRRGYYGLARKYRWRGGAASMDLPWWNWEPESREKKFPQSIDQQKSKPNLGPLD